CCFALIHPSATPIYTLSLHDALPIYDSPIIDKTIIGGRHESTKDDDIPFGKKNIGGRLVTGFAKKHRITPSSSPSFYGSPAYAQDRKSTRLNSSHVKISYAVFCLKKK